MKIATSIKNIGTLFFAYSMFNVLNAQDISASFSQMQNTDDSIELMPIAVMALRITTNENVLEASLRGWTIATTEKPMFSDPSDEWNEDDVVCFILDDHEKILDTLILRHPLKVRYEYPADDHSIGSTLVDLADTEVLIRFRYTREMKFMRVMKVNQQRQLDLMSTFTLPEEKK